MDFTILGCGRWGSFIAWYLNSQGKNVTVWGLETDPYVTNFFATRKNNYVKLNKSIELTTDLAYAVDKNDTIIISISCQSLRELIKKVVKLPNIGSKRFILCMKGIEEKTGKRLSEVLIDCGVDKNNIAVWVGPGHIQDFTRGIPGVMLIDGYDQEFVKKLASELKSDLIKYYCGNDIIGTEIGAAAKNVVGIAAGMLDGAGYQSLKGALMARATNEVSRLIEAAGGNKMSAYGLCHLGDYEATLFSKFSNNRTFGELFIKGEYFDKLAEGVCTSTALLKIGKKCGVELPIIKAVHDIVICGQPAEETLKQLLERTNVTEFK